MAFYLLQSGPREYLIVRIVASNDDPERLALSTLDEDEHARAWRLIIDNSFPRIALNQNEALHVQFVDQGEHLFCETIVREQIDDSIRLIPVQRSVYELTTLVLHAFDRLETPFGVIDFASEEVSFLPPFVFDHKFTVSTVTEKNLLDAVDKVLTHKALLKVAYNVNLVLVCCLIQLSSGAPITSIMDLDIEISTFTGSSGQISSIFELDSSPLAFVFLDDLALAEAGNPTPISAKIDQWPLTSPFLDSIRDELGEEGEEMDAKLQSLIGDLLKDVKTLTDLISSQTADSLVKANEKLWEIQLRCTTEGEEVYGRLCALFCPELTSTASLPTRHSDLKRLLAQIDPVRRTDPFIAASRTSGFFSRHKEMLKRSLELEKDGKGVDEVFLYRGSMDLSHESLATNVVAFASPKEYGLLLGCSTDYSDISLSNPHNAHSMSLGCSLFAGLLYDPTAAVWTYWASDQVKHGFVLRIPIDLHLLSRIHRDFASMDTSTHIKRGDSTEMLANPHWSDWFFIPPVPTLLALAGSGELWHARSKCSIPTSSRNATFNFVSGMLSCSYRRVPNFLLMLDRQPPAFTSLPLTHVKHILKEE